MAKKTDATTLAKFAEHVRYEVDLLQSATSRWKVAAEDGRRYDEVLYLEATLLHVRNLLEFLYLYNKSSAGITAKDYLPDWKRPSELGPFDPGRLYGEISNLLAHLNAVRIEKVGKEWSLLIITTAVVWAFTKFFDALPADKRAWFQGNQRESSAGTTSDLVTTTNSVVEGRPQDT